MPDHTLTTRRLFAACHPYNTSTLYPFDALTAAVVTTIPTSGELWNLQKEREGKETVGRRGFKQVSVLQAERGFLSGAKHTPSHSPRAAATGSLGGREAPVPRSVDRTCKEFLWLLPLASRK